MLNLGYRRYKYLQFTRNRGPTVFIQTTKQSFVWYRFVSLNHSSLQRVQLKTKRGRR